MDLRIKKMKLRTWKSNLSGGFTSITVLEFFTIIESKVNTIWCRIASKKNSKYDIVSFNVPVLRVAVVESRAKSWASQKGFI